MVAKFSSRTQNRARQAIRNILRRYVRDRRGNIAAIAALLVVPLVGVMGMATEASSWFLVQRSMQNAADSAVVAAGQNAILNTGGTTYITEGRSVTTRMGFTNGANNTTVAVTKSEACPAPLSGSNCYKVVINRNVPIHMTRLVGYNGTVALGTGRGQTITASAMAGPVNVISTYCMLTLGTTGEGIRINGGPNVDLNGCNIASNSSSGNATNCNGQNPGATNVTAVGTADANCGFSAHSGGSPIADGYASLATANASDIANSCSSYAVTTWPGGNRTLAAVPPPVCGTLKLGGNVTITSASPGSVQVIQNGQLDLNGFTLTTASGSGLTLVFNSPAGQPNIVPFPNNTGTLDIAAPKSGSWSGVALYQNRQNGSTAVVAQEYAGNKPTWDITGLVYLPFVDLTFKGIVNKSSNGYSCFSIVTYKVLISGNGAIYENANGECRQAGLTPPSSPSGTRVGLVQ